jgi:hypothetical protein
MVYKKHVHYLLIVLVELSITGCFIGFKPIEKEDKSVEKMPKFQVSLEKDAGRINYLSYEGKEIDLLREGGFHLYDATNNIEIKFSNGSVKREENRTIFDASEDNIQLHAEFISKLRLLYHAGWEPVTYAETSNKKVWVERYGNGDKVYFTVMSTSKIEQECILSLDLESLGFKGYELLVDEIAQSVSLDLRKPNQISLKLKPFKTCIIALRKQ